MLTCRFLFSLLLACLLFAHSSSAFAQIDPGQWVGDLYFVNNIPRGGPISDRVSVLIDEKNNVHKIFPNLSQATDDFIVPSMYRADTVGSFWYNDAVYDLAWGASEENKDGSLFTRWTFAKWQDDKWRFLGDYKAPARDFLKAIPCDNNRFIVVSHRNDLTGNIGADRTPFVRMSIPAGKTELRIDAPIYHRHDELKKYMAPDSDPLMFTCFNMAWASRVVITDKYATLLSTTTGIYWIFSLEKASLIKTGNIFKSVTPEMIGNGGFASAILCTNPEKEGTVLIAALEEKYFIKEETIGWDGLKKLIAFQTSGLSKEEREERDKILKRRRDEFNERNPFIVWYRIYPESGKVERLADAPEGGTILRDGDKSDWWRPMPDGSVKFGWFVDEISKEVILETQKTKNEEPSAIK